MDKRTESKWGIVMGASMVACLALGIVTLFLRDDPKAAVPPFAMTAIIAACSGGLRKQTSRSNSRRPPK